MRNRRHNSRSHTYWLTGHVAWRHQQGYRRDITVPVIVTRTHCAELQLETTFFHSAVGFALVHPIIFHRCRIGNRLCRRWRWRGRRCNCSGPRSSQSRIGRHCSWIWCSKSKMMGLAKHIDKIEISVKVICAEQVQ